MNPEFKLKIYINVYHFGTSNKEPLIMLDMFCLIPENIDELYDQFAKNLKDLYEELLLRSSQAFHEIVPHNYNREKDGNIPKDKETEENFKKKIRVLTDYCSITSAIKNVLSQIKLQKLKFTFTKLIIFTDGISFNIHSNDSENFFERSRYFGLSSYIILIGNKQISYNNEYGYIVNLKNLKKIAKKLNGECLDFNKLRNMDHSKNSKAFNLLPFKMRINLKKIINENSIPKPLEILKKKKSITHVFIYLVRKILKILFSFLIIPFLQLTDMII